MKKNVWRIMLVVLLVVFCMSLIGCSSKKEKKALKTLLELTPDPNEVLGDDLEMFMSSDDAEYYTAQIDNATLEDYKTYVKACEDVFTTILHKLNSSFYGCTKDEKYYATVSFNKHTSTLTILITKADTEEK